MLRARTSRELVEELLSLRAMETGCFTITRSCLDLIQVLKDVAGMCKEKAVEKNIEITDRLDDSENIPEVLADRDAMRRVFTNLIENAIKYTPENGHVHIDAVADEHYVMVSIQDDGIGMTNEEMDMIFSEFFQGKKQVYLWYPGNRTRFKYS